jgi:ABC-type multidrug transport system fused ATPase/permease subunit
MSDVSATLQQRAQVARDEATRLHARMNRVSVARLVTTAGFLLAGASVISEPRHRMLLATAAGAVALLFIGLVRMSQQLDTSRRAALARAKVSEQAALRAERVWPQIDPQPWTWPSDEDEPLRRDLDVVGSESLIQLLPTISRALGAPLLRAWFARPHAHGDSAAATIEELRARQTSVAELRDAIDLREAFELCARRVWLDAPRITEFVEWGRAATLPQPIWLRATTIVLPATSIVSLATSRLWLPGLSVGLLSIFLTFVLTVYIRPRSRETIRASEIGAQFADAYAALASTVLRANLTALRLRHLQEKLRGADLSLRRLHRLSDLAEVRASPMQHVVLQALFAWDFQIARAVNGWRAAHGGALNEWFSAFAELECLCAFGGLAYANPTWAFADLSSPAPVRLRASALGHPLLRDESRVANDVEIGPRGTMLLISGSNMSGKSTLLRAIGLNVLLARIGAPVCAASMNCPPMTLLTSLRVTDSLADGMSYFMAEALRLRDIVFAAEQSSDDQPLLYLIDEILRGTNSEERAVAARYIVARLLETPAIGAITTHDLGVFDVPELTERLQHAHFAERFEDTREGEQLVFDYRLRPGPATSRNALRLLRVIGLSTS